MVEIDTGAVEGVYINDFGDLGRIREGVVSVFNKCLTEETQDIDIGENEVSIDEIFIVGSYARGTANRGKSDLDIVVSFKLEGGGYMEPSYTNFLRSLRHCMDERSSEIVEGYKGWFDGADILQADKHSKYYTLERFTRETREDRDVGVQQIYNLSNDEFVDRETVLDRMD